MFDVISYLWTIQAENLNIAEALVLLTNYQWLGVNLLKSYAWMKTLNSFTLGASFEN